MAVQAHEVDAPEAAEPPAIAAAPRGRWWGWLGAAAVAGYLFYAPVLLLDSFQRTMAGVFMFATLAEAWNVIGGFTGYPSFGNVVFFGLGGYTVAVLMVQAHWPFWPALAVATGVGAGYAALLGWPLLRLRGHYFAIATLGVAEGTREVVLNLTRLTGGGGGITIPAVGAKATTSYPGTTAFYYYFLTLLIVSVLAVFLIARSRFGYALRAINQDEEAAAAVGVHTTRAKIAAFAISGAITSVAGALFAFQQVNIYPDPEFSVEITILMVVMAVIGGSGTVLGPVLGGVSLQFLSEYLRQHFTDFHTLVFGAIVVVAVVFLPQGAVSFGRDAWRARRLGLLENLRRYRL